MSCPDSVTGCEPDEISQKICLGDAVLSKQDCLTRYVEQSYLQIIIWEESLQKKMRIFLRKLLQVFGITTDTEQSKVFVSICISPRNDSSMQYCLSTRIRLQAARSIRAGIGSAIKKSRALTAAGSAQSTAPGDQNINHT